MLSVGRREVDMPRGLVVGQCPHVEDRVVAAQRQLEAVLPLGRTVAGPRVAAQPRQDRRDIMHEIDMNRRIQPQHRHRHRRGLARQANGQRPLAVGPGPDQPGARHLDDCRVESDELDHPGHVDRFAGGQLACHQKLNIGKPIAQPDLPGQNLQRRQAGTLGQDLGLDRSPPAWAGWR